MHGDGGSSESPLLTDKLARIALRVPMRAQPATVLATLAPAIARCADAGLQHRLSELLGLQAVAQRLAGDMAQAVNSLEAALEIVAARCYLRTFIDEAAELRPVAELLAQSGRGSAQLQALLQKLLPAMQLSASVSATSSASFGELTRREINIIKRLESDMSNKEIAESIFISEGTLRWHLHNIYGKLGAKNRSGALLAAHRSGLL